MASRTLSGIALALFALGASAAAGWAFHIPPLVRVLPGYPPLTLAVALGFLLAGAGLLAAALEDSTRMRRVMSACGVAVAILGAIGLAEHALKANLGIDLPTLQAWAYESHEAPGRMSRATGLALLLAGISMALVPNARDKATRAAARVAAIAVGAIAVLATMGHIVRAPLLFPDYFFAGMAVHTALGLAALALGLRAAWRRYEWGREPLFAREDDRITFMGAAILAAIAALAALAGFALLQQRVEGLAAENVQASRDFRIEQFHELVEMRERSARIAATRPAVLRNLRAIRAGTDRDGSNLANVRAVVESFLNQGFSAIAYRDAAGRVVASGGTFVGSPELAIALATPDAAELLWSEGFVLRHRIALADAGGTVGEVLTEQRMPVLTRLVRNPPGIGKSGDMGLCVIRETRLHCFPQRLNPRVFTTPLTTASGMPLPMTKALRGESGVEIARDYRGVNVVAAYGPIGNLGLGMVVKVDAAEVFAPVRQPLLAAVVLLVLLVAAGTALLRLQVRPLATRLLEAEAVARRQGDEALRAAQARAHLILDSALDAFVAIDASGRIVDWNKLAEQTFGWKRDEVLGLALADTIIPHRFRAAHIRGLDEYASKSLHPVVGRRIELAALRRDGREVPVELEITAIGEGPGMIFAGFLRDITDRARLMGTLRESEAALRRAQLLADLAHVITGVDGEFLSWSETMPALLGVAPSAMPRSTREWLAFVHPEDRETFRSLAIGAARNRSRMQFEYRLRRADGRTIHVRQVAEPAQYPDESRPLRWFSTLQDITEQKHNEDEVRRLNEGLERRVAERTAELEQSNRELEAFSYTVSHDLRAPVRAIEGFSSLLENREGENLSEEARRLLARVRHNADYMARLIDDLLTFSRMARQSVARRKVNLSDVVHHTLHELGDEIVARGVDVKVGKLPEVAADPSLISVALRNLIGNALKYTRPRKDARIEIGCEAVKGQDAIYVRDNGVGFDMQYAGKLFGVFQRLHASTEFEGTGVGLAIVQRIVQRHGGRVWAEAKPGEGATFWFTLGGGPARG